MLHPGKDNLITDVLGIKVGNSHDESVRSGVTVIIPDWPTTASIDIRGGGTGTRDTELLSPDQTVEKVDSIVLSGGSAFGLDAAGGAMNFLQQQNRGFPIGSTRVPIVPQAILFDLTNGGNKNWGPKPPYWRLGYEAAVNNNKKLKLGNSGAGFGAIAGRLKGGLGSASIYVPELDVTIGALSAVNSAGSTLMPTTRAFYAWDAELRNEFGGVAPSPDFDRALVELPKLTNTAKNTTLAVVATDAKLTKLETRRLAIIAQAGISRAIRPSHTPLDGDVVFAISTGAKKLHNRIPELSLIGGHAANCLARSIARGVYEAKSIDKITAYQDLR